jgi:predicted nuclease of restriction endonuclease-like (RecB) superfamily
MTLAMPAAEYARFLDELKERIRRARAAAALSVNHGVISLYWDLGKAITEKRVGVGWGDAVIDKLSHDLKREFPGTHGFSPRNLRRMEQFYVSYSSPAFFALAAPGLGIRRRGENWSQAVTKLLAAVPWGHHANALLGLEDLAARLYYLRAAAQFGWSRDVLINQIKANAYERAVKEKKSHNFALALPPPMAELADEMLKSRYNLEFLGIGKAVKERELEDRLIDALQAFLLELGYGFCFVARQYRLAIGEKEYFVDLLFYHRFLKALVAFELKIGPFEPEHAGQMDFYLNLLNEKERAPDDAPSIGIILCAHKDDVEVEFALKTKTNPIGVAEYQLQPRLPAQLTGRLPSAKQLADVVRDVLPARK